MVAVIFCYLQHPWSTCAGSSVMSNTILNYQLHLYSTEIHLALITLNLVHNEI